MHRFMVVALAAAVVLAASASDASGSSTRTAPGSSRSSGASSGPADTLDEGLDQLYADAVAAGEDTVVVAVSASTTGQWPEIESAFEDRFPEIDVQLKETPSFQTGSVVLGEIQAGQRTADVVPSSGLSLKPLVDAGEIVTDMDWSPYGVPESRIGDLNLLIISDGVCGTIVYNTELVDEADLPDTPEGFLDPKWEGMLATHPANSMACFAFYALAFGEEVALQLAQDLADSGMLFTESADALVVSGERPVLPFHLTNWAAVMQANGAPIGEMMYPGIGVFRSRMAILANSPSPNAARLFALFGISDEVKQIIDETSNGGSGFMGPEDPPSGLRQRVIDLGYDPDDTDFFIYEDGSNWERRASLANEFSEIVLGDL